MTSYYDDLLKLCAFDQNEIESQRQRIERTFEKLGLTPTDFEKAATRVRKYFDITLLGVRKALGVWFKELFDLVLSREEDKKIIYFGYPPFQYTGFAIMTAVESKEDFYVCCPEVVLSHTLGQVFDKLTPILEAGEATGMPPGHAMCSMLQLKTGALEKGIIPVPDMGIATSYFCDMGPKADELMQYKYGYPVHYLDSTLDAPWGQWPAYDPERVRYLGSQLNDLFMFLKDGFGLEVTEEVWLQSRHFAGRLYKAINQLNRLLQADPVPLGLCDSELIVNFSSGCTGIAVQEGAEAAEILVEELKPRVEMGVGVVAKNSPRVLLMTQSPGDPDFNRLFEEVGLAVPVISALLPPPREPESHPYPTLGEKRAEKAMFGGSYHSTYGYIKRFQEGLRSADVVGIVYNYQYSCRPMVCSAKILKHYLEKELGLPTLLLDMDYFDDRNYSAASLRTRLEAFTEMLKTKEEQK